MKSQGGGKGTPPETKVVLVSTVVTKGKRPDSSLPDFFSRDTGKFRFRDVSTGEYDVVACAGTEYIPQKRRVVVLDSSPPAVNLSLRPAREEDKREFRGVLMNRKKTMKFPNSPAIAYGYECEVARGTSNERAEYIFKVPTPPDEYTVEVSFPTIAGVVTTSRVVSLAAQTQVIDLLLDNEESAQPTLSVELTADVIDIVSSWQREGGIEAKGVAPLDVSAPSRVSVFSQRLVVNNELQLTQTGYHNPRDPFPYERFDRRGGNQLHGRLHYGIRNDALDARNFFNQPGFEAFREHDGLAELSGPIWKSDAAWFFVSYGIDRSAEAPTFSTVLASRLPELNRQFSRLGLPEENLRRFLITSARDQPSVRLDYDPHRDHTLMLRYDFQRNLLRNVLYVGPGGTSDAPSAANRVSDQNHFLTLQYIWKPPSTFDVDVRYSFRQDALSNDPVEPEQVALFIPGLARTGRALNLVGGDAWRLSNHLISFGARKGSGRHAASGGAQFGFDRNVFRFDAFRAGRAIIPGFNGLSTAPPVADLFQMGTGGSQVAFNVSVQNYHISYQYSKARDLTLSVGLQNKVELPPSFQRHELNGLQPRAGLAWAINPKTSLRLGYTLTRDRLPQFPLGFQLLIGAEGLHPFIPPPVRRVTSIIGNLAATSAFNQFLASGSVPSGPRLGITYDLDSRSPVVQTARLNLKREVTNGVVLDLAYLFTRGNRLLTTTNVNLPPPILVNGRPDFQNSVVNPAFAQIYQFQTVGSSTYHEGSFGASLNSYKGLKLQANYTLSKNIDDVLTGSFEATPENVFERRNERALSDLHFGQRLIVSADLDKRFIIIRKQKVKQEGSIFISGSCEFRSGRHFNVLTGFDANHDGNPLTDRPLGVGRNTFLGQRFSQVNLLIGSRLRMSESKNIYLTVESFNLLNRTNFATFNTVLGRASLTDLDARIVSGRRGLADYDFRRPLTPDGFGVATSAYTPRRLQIKLRFTF